MIGFAVTSFKANGVGGLISQGIGTSMLQFANIMRHPQILIAPTLAGAILGPVSTCLLKMTNTPPGAGMGTSGLVGVFDLFNYTSGALGVVGIILLMIVLPALLNLVISEFMRKKGWIKKGDMKLNI